MSCQSRFPFRIAALMLCALAPVARAEAAEVDAGEEYCFSCADFSDESSALSGVCITGLPEPGQGTVQLGDRVIRSGDILTADQLARMVFAPADSDDDATAVVSYLPIFYDHIAPEASVTISIHGKENNAPVAEDSAIETYKNLPNEGMLKVSDPEGETLVFTVTRQPKRGQIIIREDGSYLYTPEKNKVGTDSFTFTATDPAGNVSREATVTIKILKPADNLQYADTAGLSCRFAAEWMRNTGIFSGETVSGQVCFSPDEAVTRGQFLAMLMETLELPVDSSVTETGFLDASPLWLKPYLAAALRSGMITGYPCDGGVEFRPDSPITGQEAAVMIQSVLDFAVPTAVEADGSIAAWAQSSVAALNGSGLELPQGEAVLTRADTAQVLYQISKLQEGAPGLSIIFRQ